MLRFCVWALRVSVCACADVDEFMEVFVLVRVSGRV